MASVLEAVTVLERLGAKVTRISIPEHGQGRRGVAMRHWRATVFIRERASLLPDDIAPLSTPFRGQLPDDR